MIGWFLIYHCLQERCSELTCKMHMLALAGLFMTKIPWFREFDFTSVSFSAWDFRFSECLKGSICLPRQDKWLSKKQIQGISIKSVSGERLPCWHRESISQMQGTWVWSLVWEDSTCLGATKPVSHNYWAHEPQLLKPVHPRARAPQQEKSLQREAPMPQLHKAEPQQWRPSIATHTQKLID